MLTSVAYLFLFGLLAAALASRLKLPSLLGMLWVGILLGPQVFGLLDPALLALAADLRQLALVIILFRVGLALDLKDLRQVGRPAILMCWLPATVEIAGVLLLAPRLLGVSLLEAAIIGAVLAAVSPAVIVPRMLHLLQRGYGKKKSIPQLLMAGASVDDVFVIVLFTSFTAMAMGQHVSALSFLPIPLAILTGVLAGTALGTLFAAFSKAHHMRDSIKVLIMLSLAFLLLALEHSGRFPFSGMLAILCLGTAILKHHDILAKRISGKFGKLWVAAEVVLFVLVGAGVDLRYALSAGPHIILLVLGALLFRLGGVWLSLLGTRLNRSERLFCMLAYMPKATVQAAIGAIPLGLGLPCGQTVLAVAVISILLTAPAGALAIDLTHQKLLADDYLP